MAEDTSEVITSIVFFIVVVALFLLTIGYSLLTTYTSSKDVRRVLLLQWSIDANHLSENFIEQIKTFYTLSHPPLSYENSFTFLSCWSWKNLCFFLALISFISSFLLIIIAISTHKFLNSDGNAPFKLAYPAMILMTLSSNVLLLLVQTTYISNQKKKTSVLQKPFTKKNTHERFPSTFSNLTTNQNTNTSLNENGDINNNSQSGTLLNSHLNNKQVNQPPSISVYPFMNRALPSNDYVFIWSFKNLVPCAMLVLEFFQLIYFPFSDLAKLKKLEAYSWFAKLNSILKVITSCPDPIDSRLIYKLQFWTYFSSIALGVFLTFVFCIAKYTFKKSWPLHWVFFLLPLATAVYLPYLNTFLTPLSCASQFSFNVNAQCLDSETNTALYLICAFFGYFVSYVLITLFLASDERKPETGQIRFTSASAAFTKNMCFLIVFIYLIVPPSSHFIRGILSSIILSALVIHSILKRPCNLYQFNIIRSTYLSIVLYTTVYNTLIWDPNVQNDLTCTQVWFYLIVGYIIISVLGWVFYSLHMREKRLKDLISLEQHQKEAVIISPIEPHTSLAYSRTGNKKNEV